MAVSDQAARGSSPLRRPEFRLYFIGNSISNVGSWLSNIALAVYMHDLTESSFWVGLSVLGLFLPVIVLALPAGALADRVDRLVLLRRAQMWMAANAVLLTFLAAFDLATREVVVAISFGLGIGVAIGIPAMQALIPGLVPADEMPDAIRLNALTFNLARAIGPVIAAGVLATIGAVWAFAINAVSFSALIGVLLFIKRLPFPRASTGAPGPIREGLAYAWRHLRTRWLLLSIVAIGIGLDPIFTLSPELADSLGAPEGGAGWLVAMWGAGAVAMIIVGRRLIAFATAHGLGWMGLLAMAVGVVVYGSASSFAIALLGALVVGAGYILATMAFTTTIQQDVPESLRGRVSALWVLAVLGPRGIAGIVDGALADAVGVALAAAMLAIVPLTAAFLLRRVATPTIDPVPPPA